MKLRFSSRHFVVAILALLAVNACTDDFVFVSDGIVDNPDAYDFKSDGIYYNVSSEKDRTVEVTSGGSNNYRGNIIIPDGVFNDGRTYTVTSIGDYAFCYCDALTSVDLSSTSLTTIGSSAFTGSNALTSVEFPASLTTIEGFAFSNCHALTRVELPASLTSIDDNVFRECTSLSKLTVDEDNPVFTSRNNVLYSKNLDTLVCYPTGLDTNVVIPDRVRVVRDNGTFPGKVSAVYCQPQTPPAVLFYYTFSDDELMNAVLYVPIGTKAAYMQVAPWRDFRNIEETDFSTVGINGVTAQSEPLVTVRDGK